MPSAKMAPLIIVKSICRSQSESWRTCICVRVRECMSACMCDMQWLADLGLPCKESEAEYDDDRHAHGYENRVRLIPSEHGPTVP